MKLLHLAFAVIRKPQSGFRSSEWNLMTQLDAGTHTAGLPCKPGPGTRVAGIVARMRLGADLTS